MRNVLGYAGTALVATIVLTVGFSGPASALIDPDPGSARGTIKIEEIEVTDSDNPNEVKVGCNFSIDFFGMEAGAVPVTFTAMAPLEEGVLFTTNAEVEEAQGTEYSGVLEVDLTDELAPFEPAGAEDFDYKVRVDAEVKSTEGNPSITKSAILFIVCDTAGAESDEGIVDGTGEVAGDDERTVPVGGVAAGLGGAANDAGASTGVTPGAAGLALLGGIAASLAVMITMRVRCSA